MLSLSASCAEAVKAAAVNITVPEGVVMISPSVALPFLTDQDLVFSNVTPTNLVGDAMSSLLLEMNISNIVVIYENTDAARSFTDSFLAFYAEGSGVAPMRQQFKLQRSDYHSELSALASLEIPNLMIVSNAGTEGKLVLQQAIENGHFTKFILSNGMISRTLLNGIDTDAQHTFIGLRPVGYAFNDKKKITSMAERENVILSEPYVS